jgi:hypothetical protein
VQALLKRLKACAKLARQTGIPVAHASCVVPRTIKTLVPSGPYLPKTSSVNTALGESDFECRCDVFCCATLHVLVDDARSLVVCTYEMNRKLFIAFMVAQLSGIMRKLCERIATVKLCGILQRSAQQYKSG